VPNTLNRSLGELSFPLAPSTASNFAPLDPARDILLELLKAGINAELAPVWSHAANGSVIETALPVQSAHPFEPDPQILQQFKAEFPALFVYRDDDEPHRFDEFTFGHRRLTSRWGIDYILGPFDIGRTGKLRDVLIAVEKIIHQVIRVGGHEAYSATETLSGQPQPVFVFGEGGCGFSSVELTEFRIWYAPFTPESPRYLAAFAKLTTTELDGSVDVGSADFEGARVQLSGDSAGTVADLIVADTDPEYDP
jgi:hypothetical protein